MSTLLEDPERRVVPRWRPWREAVALAPVDPPTRYQKISEPNPKDLIQAQHDWVKNRSLPFAGDFIGIASALGQGKIAEEAAAFILESRQHASRAAIDLAKSIVSPPKAESDIPRQLSNQEASRKNIQRLRSNLHEFPRNALSYMDLAREYVVLGQPFAALKPIQLALSLAPNNRFVIRSASRFYLHISDHERAHDLLRNASSVRSDPWIMAAEIAVASAAGRTSTLIKMGRQIIDSRNYNPSHISELASALGTLELHAGNIRFVRRFFRQALESPTENAVAQAAWVSRRVGNIDIDPRAFETPNSYEALAWSNITAGHWSESLNSAVNWLRDEPFSKRPAVFGSWVALMSVGELHVAEMLTRHGLTTHPKDFILLNNLAVSLAYQGKAEEALSVFSQIQKEQCEPLHIPTYLATEGLIKFRLNKAEEGRKLYGAAIAEARNRKNHRSSVWALLHFAREEFRLSRTAGQILIDKALPEIHELTDAEKPIAKRLLELVSNESKGQV
jgi:tetratricopeptide (TPR) repeat protein